MDSEAIWTLLCSSFRAQWMPCEKSLSGPALWMLPRSVLFRRRIGCHKLKKLGLSWRAKTARPCLRASDDFGGWFRFDLTKFGDGLVKPKKKVFQRCAGPRKSCMLILFRAVQYLEVVGMKTASKNTIKYPNNSGKVKIEWRSTKVPVKLPQGAPPQGGMRQWSSRRSSASRQQSDDVRHVSTNQLADQALVGKKMNEIRIQQYIAILSMMTEVLKKCVVCTYACIEVKGWVRVRVSETHLRGVGLYRSANQPLEQSYLSYPSHCRQWSRAAGRCGRGLWITDAVTLKLRCIVTVHCGWWTVMDLVHNTISVMSLRSLSWERLESGSITRKATACISLHQPALTHELLRYPSISGPAGNVVELLLWDLLAAHWWRQQPTMGGRIAIVWLWTRDTQWHAMIPNKNVLRTSQE